MNNDIINKWRKSDTSVTGGDFTLLPDWTWCDIDSILEMEKEWKSLTEKLNRGQDIIDIEYWTYSSRIVEYKKLKLDVETLEIKMTQTSHKLCDRLVEWRDTNYSSKSYDEDEGKSYKENEPFTDAVAYFYMSINREWYKTPFQTDDGVVRYRETREKIRKKIEKEFG